MVRCVDLTATPNQELLVNRVAIIAAPPEPAYGPTHGLLSRRSTDRISTSPLANFAQLSMFRFDGVTILAVLTYINTSSIIKLRINTIDMKYKRIYFCKYR